ncbi:MAG TPA: hypothetical protein VMA34_03680 [Terracidiphilus sp.]|nr:hypothetical protein [Terracidiphilus sp.]
MTPLLLRAIFGGLSGVVEIATLALLNFAVRRSVRVVARYQADASIYRGRRRP